MNTLKFLCCFICFLFVSNESYAQSSWATNRALSDSFKDYWYNGEAEITSYQLEQARYGEIHEGTAVLIFVSEPFSAKEQVKVDEFSNEDVSVLKLNFEKKFNTGIYPYSMMTSSFLPIVEKNHLIKLTSSSQEWCGHTFMQLNNRENYELKSYSYFQSEGDKNISLQKDLLEDELWSLIRIAPDEIPTGEVKLIPSFFYLRLRHIKIKSYQARINKEVNAVGNIQLIIDYPELDRVLNIEYERQFPYSILSWEEKYVSGWGSSSELLTTKGTRMKVEKLDYWRRNKVKDGVLRTNLGLTP